MTFTCWFTIIYSIVDFVCQLEYPGNWRWFFIAIQRQKKCSDLLTKINELQASGKSLQEIAHELGISRTYLYQIRKNHNMPESRRGKKSTVDTEQLKMLHSKGLTDEVIAQHMGISRSRVVKARKEIGLPANRRVGERGPGKLRDQVPYIQEVRRVMNDAMIARIIRQAARKYREDGGDEETAWAATVIEPRSVFHPAPGSYCVKADKTNLTHVKYAVQVETMADFAGICGLPGVELVERALEIRGSVELAPTLACLVSSSGYMGTHTTTAQAKNRNPDSVHIWNQIWGSYRKESEEWAPVKEESKKKLITYGEKGSISNGKKGKGGGYQNIQARQAYMGALGY